jgi:hypothetical protein
LDDVLAESRAEELRGMQEGGKSLISLALSFVICKTNALGQLCDPILKVYWLKEGVDLFDAFPKSLTKPSVGS